MFRKLNQVEFDSIRELLSNGWMRRGEWHALTKLMQNYQDTLVELAEHEETIKAARGEE